MWYRNTPLRVACVIVAAVALSAAQAVSPVLAASPIAAPPPDEEQKPPAVVDGSHFPALSEITRRISGEGHAPNLDTFVNHPTPPLGTNVAFWSWDFARGAFHPLTATLKRVGQSVDLYVENGHSLTAATLDAVLRACDTAILPRAHQAFGSEPSPGIDSNRHVTVLLLDIRDGFYYQWGGPLVGGYFWLINQYAQRDLDGWFPGSGYKSNEREMIFVDVWATTPGSRESYQVIAHELQHLIHWNYDPAEAGWLNEGMSNLAAFLSGYGLPGAHVESFLNYPNKPLTDGTADALADYGAYGLFGLFLWEHYGGDGLTRDLTRSTATGVSSINTILARRGYSDRFPQVVSRWALANFLDDPAISAYRGLDIVTDGADGLDRFRRPEVSARHAAYPTGAVSTAVASWAADYIWLTNLPQGNLVLTLTAGIGANFTVNVITTTSASFATGTNRLREVSVASGSSSVVTIPGAGTAYTNVLLVPVNVSPGIERVAFSYQAHVQVQATPPRLPYAKRINSGGGAYVDSRGQTWEADRPYATGGAGYVNGSSSSVAPGAGATGDAAVYQNERWGMTAYKLDVPNGVYTVTLKFAEHYFARAGMRLFDVRIENQAALTNFDIFQSAGGRGLGVDRTFVVNVTDGNLTILFVPRRGHATICGLAVVSGAP